MFQNVKRGVYVIGGRVLYLRSEWEAKHACYLEWLKRKKQIKDWKYEPKTFEFPIKHGTTRYMPDFKVINNNGTHHWEEVKGYLTGKGKTQIKRFKKYFPKEKLIVYEKEWFKSVKNKEKLWLRLSPNFLGK